MIIQTNQISPNLSGAANEKNISVPVQYAKDGNVGNVKYDTTKDCTVPREAGKNSVYTEAEAKQLHNNIEGLSDDGQFSPSAFINSCMTGEDMKDLSDEGTPLEEYTSSRLERAVSRVKEQRTEKREFVDAEVSKEREQKDAIEKHLVESGLPVSAENATRLSNAVDLTTDLSQLSQDSVKFFIGTGKQLTPENIGASSFSTTSVQTPVEKADFSEMESQVANILTESGMTASEENMDTAKWLYDNDLSVTPENIQTYQKIQELKGLDTDTLLSRIVDDMIDGMIAEKADLTKISSGEAADAIGTLLATDDQTLRKTYTTEADFISAKRQLEEIRLSMTIDAARTMSTKGISLDVTNLTQIVENLKEQEQQAKENLLLETDTPVTQKNADVMSGTIQAAKNVLSAPIETLANTYSTGDSRMKLQALSDSAKNLTEQYEQAGQAYESVGTEVRRDLGDSMTKAFQNVDDILDDLGMEVTGMNQRAVRILAYNQMPINEENIVSMKQYDANVTNVMQSLKPQVVSQLIKDEINPLELSLDELSDKVSEITENVSTEDISLRKYLWKMDRDGSMTSDERRSMIGVYRLLDKVEKSDGAMIGQVVKEGKELSLSSLLSATRTKKAEGMDISIDDEFGGLEETVTSGTSISEQIMSAYGASLVSGLKKTLSPHVLQEAGSDELSLETLLEKCTQDETMDADMAAYYDQMVTQLKDDISDPDGLAEKFLQELDMPASAANISMAKAYMENGAHEYSSLWKKEESDEVIQAFDDPDELDSFYEELDQSHEEALADAAEDDDITYDDVKTLAKMAGSISFYQNLRSHETYEVPIFTEQGVTTCNVTIKSGDTPEKGTVEVSMNSEELGRIQATFKVNAKQVKGFVTAEQKDSLEECQDILNHFEKDLEENGFTMERDNLIQGSRRSSQFGDKAEGTKNSDLYQVAKLFIMNVNGKDDWNEN